MKFFLFILMLFCSCRGVSDRDVVTDSDPDAPPIPAESTALYYGLCSGYPHTAQLSEPDRCTIRYSKLYYNFQEPILLDYRGDREIYRFGWFRSFNRWYIFRIEKRKARYVLTLKGSGDDFESLLTVKQKYLSASQWKYLQNLLDSASFWNLTGFIPSTDMDGSHWAIEGYKNGKYKAVVRPGPTNKSDEYLFLFGEYIIKLAELKDEGKNDIH